MQVWQAPRAIVRRGRGATAGTALVCMPEPMSPQARFKGRGSVHLAMRVMQALLTSRGSRSDVSLAPAMTRVWHQLPHAMTWASALVMWGCCAELSEFRTDITHLRLDLHATTQVLSQLSARMDALERRQGEAESDVRQTQHDLSKALSTKGRQLTRDSGKRQSPATEQPEGQARELAAGRQGASSRGGHVQPGRSPLSLGMTQDEVRHRLGDPLGIEPVGAYVFWHYSPMRNHRYVIFEHMSGQVSGWRDP